MLDAGLDANNSNKLTLLPWSLFSPVFCGALQRWPYKHCNTTVTSVKQVLILQRWKCSHEVAKQIAGITHRKSGTEWIRKIPGFSSFRIQAYKERHFQPQLFEGCMGKAQCIVSRVARVCNKVRNQYGYNLDTRKLKDILGLIPQKKKNKILTIVSIRMQNNLLKKLISASLFKTTIVEKKNQ